MQQPLKGLGLSNLPDEQATQLQIAQQKALQFSRPCFTAGSGQKIHEAEF